MSVCLSDGNFRKTSRRKFIFAHPVYLQAIRVKFVYEGNRVKVKVTGPKKVHNRYIMQRTPACQDKCASPQCENSIANNSASITHSAVKCACSIGFSLTADRVA